MRDILPLVEFSGPALVFGGEQSVVLPPSMFERVASHLPSAELSSLPNANHRLCQDNPVGFAQKIDGFLQQAA
jgi:pimeloyl-ACP methyl ester carboxylesterase